MNVDIQFHKQFGMTPEQKANLQLWIDDLESTTEPQCKSSLHSLADNNTGYCCLGRAAQVMKIPSARHDGKWLYEIHGSCWTSGFPDHWFVGTFGLAQRLQADLMRMNDSEGKSFKEIAAFLREVVASLEIDERDPHEVEMDAIHDYLDSCWIQLMQDDVDTGSITE